jgi:hypothetical protein
MRALAEYIVDYLSEDAVHWPLPAGRRSAGEPARVAFRWFGSFIPASGRELLDQLALVLRSPYRSPDRVDAVFLLYADDPADADAEMVLADVRQDDAPGVAYELHFATGGGPFPGWFRRAAD